MGSPSTELLRAVRAGAPEAVDAWFHAEHPAVYRLCFGFLAHAADAEDLAQESMLRLLDKLAEWDPARPYRAWRTSYRFAFHPVAFDESTGSLTADQCTLIEDAGEGSRTLFTTSTLFRGGEYTVLAGTGASTRLLVVRVTPQG